MQGPQHLEDLLQKDCFIAAAFRQLGEVTQTTQARCTIK